MSSLMIFITFAHFISDFFIAFFNPLIPFFMDKFNTAEPKTFTMLASVLAMISSISQIFFGYMGDKASKKLTLLYIFVFLTLLPSTLIGNANTFFLLAIVLIIGYLGNAGMHPLGASISGEIGKGKGMAVAFFIFGGTFGSALGPIFITNYVKNLGLETLWIFGITILIFYSLFYYFASSKHKESEFLTKKEHTATSLPDLLHGLKYLYPIWFLILYRSFINGLLHTYAPIRTNKILGLDITTGGLLLSLGVIAGMFTALWGTKIYEKTNIRFLNILSFSGYALFLLLFSLSTNIYVLFITYILADSFMFLTMSANVSYSQKLLPNHKGVASGVSMGFAWAFGNLADIIFIQFFGNNISLTINLLPIFAIIGTVISFIIIKKHDHISTHQ